MKYANTTDINGVETVVTVLPLDMVPSFDPENLPQENTYGVPDFVEPGWVLINGEWLPPTPPVETPVPTSVTRFQALAALHGAGLLPQVETYMADANTPVIQKLAWQNALDFERTSPTVAALAALLSLTDTQVDSLFISAKAIRA